MAFYNNINKVKRDFDWPSEQIFVIETTSETDAEGTININYDGITSIDTTDIKIFESTAPMVPETKYTNTGLNLYTGTEFDVYFTACTKGTKVLYTANFSFKTNLLSVNDGDFYTVQIKINNIINIIFVVKIKDVLV